MKHVCLFTSLILCFLLSSSVLAQSKDQITGNARIMKRIMAESDRYSFASASDDTLDVAVSHAVQLLAGQISTNVKVTSEHSLSSMTKDKQLFESEMFRQVANTFTNVNLKDYHVLTVGAPTKKKNEYTAFVYIGNDKVEEIVREIQEKEKAAVAEKARILAKDIQFYYDEGCRSLQDLRIGDALKYFYWGAALSSGTEMAIKDEGVIMTAHPLFDALIDRTMNNIIVQAGCLQTKKVNDFQTTHNVQLAFFFKDGDELEKITNLDFSYHDGNTYLTGARVRDGVSMIELNYPLDEISVCCTYQYEENETPSDVAERIRSVKMRSYSSAYKTARIDKNAKPVPMLAQVQDKDESLTRSVENVDDAETLSDTVADDYSALKAIVDDIVDAIEQKQYYKVRYDFTEEGYDCFCKLVANGEASVIDVPELTFIKFGNLTLCRSITMLFRYRGNKQFVENVTFRFNKDGLIESLAYTLSEVAQKAILDNDDWKRESKLTLLSFMEDYQTAYALRRIDYLERIFSENALIISGYKVMKKEHSDGICLHGYTRYDTLNKAQYMNRLGRQFKTKEYINLNFTDTDFKQAFNVEDFFGIRVRQEYFSSNYGDVGYLFLLVDLRGEDPIIHVRAWQDDKVDIKKLFDLKDVY